MRFPVLLFYMWFVVGEAIRTRVSHSIAVARAPAFYGLTFTPLLQGEGARENKVHFV